MIATDINNDTNSKNLNQFDIFYVPCLLNICYLDVRIIIFICIQHTDEDLVKSKPLF